MVTLSASTIMRQLREEATRYEAAAKQQDEMARWTSRPEPARRSRQRAQLFREAARLIEEAQR